MCPWVNGVVLASVPLRDSKAAYHGESEERDVDGSAPLRHVPEGAVRKGEAGD